MTQHENRFNGGIAGAALAACLVLSGSAAAQAPVPPASEAAAVAQGVDVTPPAVVDAQGEPYSYRPDGRRDPFVSLIARGTEAGPATGARGMAGLTTAELSVTGVLHSEGTFIAMVQGADTQTHIAHVNDRLYDGVITQITQQGLVILQEVNDPLSLVKQREVRKSLRSLEEAQ